MRQQNRHTRLKQTGMNPRAIESADWNFDTVPNEELVACCYWEYARESAFIRELRQRCLKEQQASGDRDEPLHRDLQRVQSIGHPANFFLHGFFCPPDGVLPDALPLRPGEVYRLTGSFPKPWQLLTKAEREYRAFVPPHGIVDFVQMVPFERGLFLDAKDIVEMVKSQRRQRDMANEQARRANPRLTDEALTRLGKLQFPDIRPSVIYKSGTENTVVQISWGLFTNEEIIQSFRKWVKANRPEDIRKPDGKGRNKARDWRAQLTRLSVMRLLAHFTPLDIIDPRQNKFPEIWKTKQYSGRKWGDATKWHDARREAEHLFRKLFPFLPTDEKPLSWGRQKPGK